MAVTGPGEARARDDGVRRVTILGSTGSVGQNTVDLLLRNREVFEVEALTANRNPELLAEQARALQQAELADGIEPGSGDISVVRGQIHERAGRTAEAIANYTAAVRANGSDPQARARLASLAMRTRQFDIARPQFETLLRMGYRPSRMHFGLAQIAEATGDPQRAIVEYREAIRIEPSFADAKTALARLGG